MIGWWLISQISILGWVILFPPDYRIYVPAKQNGEGHTRLAMFMDMGQNIKLRGAHLVFIQSILIRSIFWFFPTLTTQNERWTSRVSSIWDARTPPRQTPMRTGHRVHPWLPYSHQSSRHPPKKIETLQLITSDSLVGMDWSSFFGGFYTVFVGFKNVYGAMMMKQWVWGHRDTREIPHVWSSARQPDSGVRKSIT